MMRIPALALFLVTAIVLGSPVGAKAPEQVVCVTVSGTPPDGGWDEASLSEAIADGSATLVRVAGAAACLVGPEVVVPEGGPLPVEVVDSGCTTFPRRDDDYVSYAVVLRNPNEVGWIADFMQVATAFRDKGCLPERGGTA